MRTINIYPVVILLLVVFSLFLFSSCDKAPSIVQETGNITDKEGNTYKTIRIGNQWWMAENLKTTVYNDSASIEKIENDTSKWSKNTSGAYCAGDAGILYNGFAISNLEHSLAPQGWRIPTDEDWKILEQYLGMSPLDAERVNWRGTIQGDKLKAKGIENWIRYPGVWATNESGFTALAGNCRMFNGGSGYPVGVGYMGFWWSQTENANNGQIWYRHLDYKSAKIFRFYGSKNYGFSVRCVKE